MNETAEEFVKHEAKPPRFLVKAIDESGIEFGLCVTLNDALTGIKMARADEREKIGDALFKDKFEFMDATPEFKERARKQAEQRVAEEIFNEIDKIQIHITKIYDFYDSGFDKQYKELKKRFVSQK